MWSAMSAARPEEIPVGNWTVHTGQGSAEAFVCSDWQDCDSVTGSGSSFRGPASSSGANSIFKQAGTGATWYFSVPHTTGGQTRQAYLASISHPTGETISYTYEAASGGAFGFTFRRPLTITSNRGFFISITYQGSDLNGDPGAWGRPSVVTIAAAAAPTVPLARLTYSGDTITDLAGRVFTCTGCNNALGNEIETTLGSMQLPGEGSPAVQVTPIATSAQPVVASVTRDGVTWSYAYTNLRLSGSTYLYDRVTVTGPNDFNQQYNMTVSGQRNVMTSSVDSIGRPTAYLFDPSYRPTQVTYPEGNRVNVAYDGYGNVTSRTETPKPGSPGLLPITQTAGYTPCPDPPDAVGNNVLCYRAIWSRDGMNRQTDYAYNMSGQLTEQLDPADAGGVRRRTSILYAASSGAISRRSEVRICADAGASCPATAPIRTEYQYWGNTDLPTLERRIDGVTGQILDTVFAYDGAGRLLSADGPLPGSADATYSRYDVLGRRTWEIGAADAGGVRLATRSVYRDSDDKLLFVERGTIPAHDSAALTVLSRTDFAYDPRRNPVREAVSAAGGVHGLIERSFDDRGRLLCEARRMDPASFPATPLGAQAVTPAACAAQAPGAFGADRITKNVYDAAGQRLQHRVGVGSADEGAEATWEHGDNGQITAVTDGNGNRAELHYDGHMRQDRWTFPSANGPPGTVNAADYEEYSYDAAGNRLSHRKRDGSVINYQYDDLNRLLRKTVPERAGLDPAHTRDVFYGYDLRNLQLHARFDSHAGPGITNAWDGFGRLQSTVNSSDGNARVITYQHDAAGNRTRITLPDGNWFNTHYDPALCDEENEHERPPSRPRDRNRPGQGRCRQDHHGDEPGRRSSGCRPARALR